MSHLLIVHRSQKSCWSLIVLTRDMHQSSVGSWCYKGAQSWHWTKLSQTVSKCTETVDFEIPIHCVHLALLQHHRNSDRGHFHSAASRHELGLSAGCNHVSSKSAPGWYQFASMRTTWASTLHDAVKLVWEQPRQNLHTLLVFWPKKRHQN